ncbi:MAG: outer membrane beta-barrel protein, partial [Prevotellaceae bacterium]|nr:outer membrane beta-barrel protein [Prevotellaceae bacterium]
TAGHSQDLRQADFADPSATLNLNYRHQGLDIFGMVNSWNQHTLQRSTVDQHIFTMTNSTINENWQKGWADTKSSNHGMNYALGTNWMVNEKHSLGWRFQVDHLLSSKSPLLLHEDVYNNGAFFKTIASETFTKNTAPLGYNLNTYYNGQWGRMNIDWNLDWNTKGGTEDMNSASDKVYSSSSASSHLLATKLVASYPLWKGLLNAGTEMIWVNRDIDYTINQDYIADSHSRTNEDTYAAFVEYMANFGKYGVAKVGARYEYVSFDFVNLVNGEANVCDTRNGLYPSLTYSVQLGRVGLALNYSTKTIRPNFYHLTDATTYASHSILMQGNSQLRNQIQHQLGLNARWRWLLGSISYTLCDHMI